MSDLSPKELHALQTGGAHAAVLEALSDLTEPRGDAVHQCLLKGISLHLTGQGEAASPFLIQAMAEGLVDKAEGDPAFRKDIAMACLLIGQMDRAREVLSGLIEDGIEDAVTYGRLATVCLLADELDAAERYFQEAVRREAGRAEWHNNLGGVLVRQQRLEEALENYEVALRLNPDFEKSKNAREQVLVALDRTDDVIAQLEGDLKEAPNKLSARLKLARALSRGNRVADAINTLVEARLPPEEIDIPEPEEGAAEDIAHEETAENDDIGSWQGQITLRAALATIFAERDMYGRALSVLDSLLNLKPANPLPFIRQKADALVEMGGYDKAEALLDEAEEEHGDKPPLRLARAGLYTESGRYAEAETLQRNLLETYPGDAQLMSQLGQTLLWTGKLDEAAALFEQSADTNPMALAQMVNAKHIPEDPKALEKMCTVADNPFLEDAPRITMSFALAEIYDKKKDYETAFHYLDQANRLSAKAITYDVEEFSRKVDDHIALFTPDFFRKQEAIRPSLRTPIFVVGMPRSGTTLTEQILCSHPKVFGAGELGLMSQLARLTPAVLKTRTPYPKCLEEMTPHLREEGARYYLRGLDAYDTDHAYVVDKMPHNFVNVGLIALIFPRAKIIHIKRDPRDNALSNYQQNFKARHGGLGYSFDLEKTAHQINDYHRLMEHWRQVLPMPMFELTYEELVADQEGMTRALLDFVGLEWSDDVRDFHKTERAVRTASVAQVRQKIYQTSKQKWRRYEAHLTPLLETLKPETTALWDAAVADPEQETT